MKVVAEFSEDYFHQVRASARLVDDGKYLGERKREAARQWKAIMDRCFEKYKRAEGSKVWFSFSIQICRANKEGWVVKKNFRRENGCPTEVSRVAVSIMNRLLEGAKEVA